MDNVHLHHYHPIPICDTHIHLVHQDSLEKTVKIYQNIMDYFCYERIVLLAMPHQSKGDDPANNAKVLYCKSIMNETSFNHKVYAYGAPFHYFDNRDTADGYLRQIRLMDALGFDGIKLLEGKPTHRKKLGRRLDDPIFDLFYEYAQDKQIPIKLHLGDPSSFWNLSAISPFALEQGWFYDESFPSLDDLRQEVEGILYKFPLLRLELAHFYFLSDNLKACEKFFDNWEHVSFDICPGLELFSDFSDHSNEWRCFFQTHADRISFGTDTYNLFYSDNLADYEEATGLSPNLCRYMLEKSEPFNAPILGRLTPLNLDGNTLHKIYHDNCINTLGEPRKISKQLASSYVSDVLTKLEHCFVHTKSAEQDLIEIENLKQIYNYFLT